MEEINYHPLPKTTFAKVWVEDGIIRVIYLKNAEIDLAAKKDLHRKYIEFAEFKSIPMLLELEDNVTITKEARVFARKIEPLQPFNSCAVIVNSLAYQILANFYAKFYRPTKPFKVFTNKEEAFKWLAQFK